MIVLAMVFLFASVLTAVFGLTGWAAEATAVCLIAFPFFALLAIAPLVFAISPRGKHGRRQLAH